MLIDIMTSDSGFLAEFGDFSLNDLPVLLYINSCNSGYIYRYQSRETESDFQIRIMVPYVSKMAPPLCSRRIQQFCPPTELRMTRTQCSRGSQFSWSLMYFEPLQANCFTSSSPLLGRQIQSSDFEFSIWFQLCAPQWRPLQYLTIEYRTTAVERQYAHFRFSRQQQLQFCRPNSAW